MSLADGHIYNADNIKNSLICKGKGRPTAKRLKSFNEESSKAKVQAREEKRIEGEHKYHL
ncbi:7841_t:CDS:1, partial [Funneliformis caledonium]